MSNDNQEKREQQLAVVMGRNQGTLSDSVERIKARVSGVNDEAAKVASRITSRVKTKDVDTSEKVMMEAVMALEEALPKTTTKSFFDKFLEVIPGAKRLKKSIDRTLIENISADAALERAFAAVDSQLQDMTADLQDLHELTIALDTATEECDLLEQEISKELEEISKDKTRRMELITLRNLQREISSIKIVNAQTANNIDMQYKASEALSTKFSEVRPLLKSMAQAQLALGSQIAKNKRTQEFADGISNMLNTMVTEQNASAQETLQDTIRLAHKPVITEKTMIELSTQHEKAKKEMVKLIQDISNNNQRYLEVQKKTEQTLRNGDIKQIAMELAEKEEKKNPQPKKQEPQGE